MATSVSQRLLTADEFLRIDFGPDLKAELDNGVIRMMAGGTRRHNRVQTNLIIALGNALRGSGCRPNGSDLGVRTHDGSVRYPDISISCGPERPEDDRDRALADPRVLIEVLSPSTEASDRSAKLPEYKALPSVELIALVDPESERLHLFQRTNRRPESWSEVIHVEPADLELPMLGITIPHGEIFARD
jgi:Uma2 family endonuclease